MILPTDDEPRIISGEGESLEHKMIPRTAMLINLLSEFGISLDDCKIFVGTNKPEVVRQENYRMFTIKPREKIIYVCDEEGNSTYILHNYTEDDSDLKRLMALKKSELKAMGELVDKIDWSNKDTWQEEIFKALTKKSPVPDGIKNWQEYIRKIRDEAVARKKEKEKFVDLETLKAKVRAAGIDSKPTYKKEQKNHPSWPSNPNRTYGEEWVSWPDLWGKKYVDLETLKAEVRAAGINSQPKYRIEQKNRPSWPSGPEYHYGEEWVSWPDLWGKKFVDLETLKAEVKAAGVDSEPKYRIEQKNHPSWPSSPRVHYGEEWVSWTDLWGK